MPDTGLKKALEPGALQKSVEKILPSPEADSGTKVDVGVIKTEDDLGAEVKVTTTGSWWSAAAWAQWMRDRGWAAGALGTFKWGGKK